MGTGSLSRLFFPLKDSGYLAKPAFFRKKTAPFQNKRPSRKKQQHFGTNGFSAKRKHSGAWLLFRKKEAFRSIGCFSAKTAAYRRFSHKNNAFRDERPFYPPKTAVSRREKRFFTQMSGVPVQTRAVTP